MHGFSSLLVFILVSRAASARTKSTISEDDVGCKSIDGAEQIVDSAKCRCSMGLSCVQRGEADTFRSYDCADNNGTFSIDDAAIFNLGCSADKCQDFNAVETRSGHCQCDSPKPIASGRVIRSWYAPGRAPDSFKLQYARMTNVLCFEAACDRFGGEATSRDAAECECIKSSCYPKSACVAGRFPLRSAQSQGVQCVRSCSFFQAEDVETGEGCTCSGGRVPVHRSFDLEASGFQTGKFTIKDGVQQDLKCDFVCPKISGLRMPSKVNASGNRLCSCEQGQTCEGSMCQLGEDNVWSFDASCGGACRCIGKTAADRAREQYETQQARVREAQERQRQYAREEYEKRRHQYEQQRQRYNQRFQQPAPARAARSQHLITLGFPADSNPGKEELRNRWMTLVRASHPDKNPSRQHEAKVTFQKIQEAYEALSGH